MLLSDWKKNIHALDVQRDIVIPGDKNTTLQFCIEHFLFLANKAIEEHGYFAVALSGGTTPKEIFQALALPENSHRLDWQRVLLFWSDERCVPKDDPESNYKMAMEAGFTKLAIPAQNIFSMPTEGDLESCAKNYENLILEKIALQKFDLVMLGMGDDGHTASLFPGTHALHPQQDALVTMNFIPQKKTWRMTLTFACINAAANTAIYVMGKNKAQMLNKVLTEPYQPDLLPVQCIGTPINKALWIVDEDAASLLA